jgi:hypothetical protein
MLDQAMLNGVLHPHSPDETAISGTFGTVFDYYSASYR